MSPQPWFLIGGVLFIVAVIGGLVLLALVALLTLRAASLGILADQQHHDQQHHDDGPDAAVVLADLLADLAAHHQRQQTAWDDGPVIDLNPPQPRRRRS